MQKKWKSLLGLVLSASLVLGGCSLFNSGASTDGSSSMSQNQVLRISENADIVTLDSVKVADTVSANILNNVQEGLYRQGKEKQPVPGIAESVEISPDKKTYTFKLRQDALWSDGVPVKAQDFEYAWKRALDPKTASEYAYIFAPIVNAEEYNAGKAKEDEVGVRAIDDHTLVVHLKQPMFNFISLTTLAQFYPQRQDIVEKYKDKYGQDPDSLVYNGPFTVKSRSPQQIVLEKNEQYWDKNAVSLTEVQIHVVKDTASGINLYNSGKLDSALLNQAFVDAYKQTPDYVQVEQAATFYILFNHKENIFKNEKIRKAISLAIDRETFTSSILKDGSKPAGSLIPPSLNGVGNKSFREGEDIVTPNVKLARELFTEGLKELGLPKPPDNITMIAHEQTSRKDVAINIKEQLRVALGLNIKLESPAWKIHLDRMGKGDYKMGMLGWGADYNDPMSFFEIFQSNNPMNWGRFSNQKYDELIEQAKKETDQQKQYELFKQAEKILVGTDADGKAAFVPLWYGGRSYVQKTYVKDLYRHPYGSEYTLKWAYIGKEKDK